MKSLWNYKTRAPMTTSKLISHKWTTLRFAKLLKRITVAKTLKNLWWKLEIQKSTRNLLNICSTNKLRNSETIHLNNTNKNMDNLMSLKNKLSKTKSARRDEIATWSKSKSRSRSRHHQISKFCWITTDKWKLKTINNSSNNL